MTGSANLEDRIEDIVHLLEIEGKLGEPFKGKTRRDERRFGTKGSLSIMISGASRGKWYDHERQTGGGAIKLIWEFGGYLKGEAFDNWVRDKLGLYRHPGGGFTDEPPRAGGRIIKAYDYVDEQGRVLFQVVRSVDRAGTRYFWQRRPDGKGGWVKGRGTARLVLYRLPELIAARATVNGHPWRVYLCEGEKDADRLREQWGVVATTNPGGAGNWQDDFDIRFAGAEVILLEDNDKAGRARSAKLAPRLARVAVAVRVIPFPHLEEGGDISDWLDAGGTQSDLETVIEQTEPYDPTEDANNPKSLANDEWPVPAALLEDTPVPRFPADFLPGALGTFAEQQAFDLQAPLDFVAIPLLIVAGTAIGNDFRMAPKAHASWAERPCLWGGVVGYVGDGKTPAFSAALSPIWPLQAEWREEFGERSQEHKVAVRRARAISKQWDKDAAAALKRGDDPPPVPEGAEPPEAPKCREMIAIDTTQERVAALLMHNPRGVLMFRDELSGWFSSFNQYRAGSDEQFYLQCHAGGRWLQYRKGGDIIIPDVFLSVFGGFQPDVIAATLARGFHTGKPDNGMTARFSLLVWPEPVPHQWVDNSPDRDLRERIDRLFERLSTLDPETFVGPRPGGWSHFPPLRFTPEGHDVFREWYVAHHQAQDALEPDAQIRGHFAKYDGLFARLALLHHLLRYAQDEPVEPGCADAVTVRAVRRFIDGYLRPHACKIYGHLAKDPGYDGAKRIARWLLDNPDVERFTAREISRKGWSGLTGRDENTRKDYLRAALDHLDKVAGWVRGVDNSDVVTQQGGRPTTIYLVNPKIHRMGPYDTPSSPFSGGEGGFVSEKGVLAVRSDPLPESEFF